jgi:uncharacterized protein (TIGR02246 family)
MDFRRFLCGTPDLTRSSAFLQKTRTKSIRSTLGGLWSHRSWLECRNKFPLAPIFDGGGLPLRHVLDLLRVSLCGGLLLAVLSVGAQETSAPKSAATRDAAEAAVRACSLGLVEAYNSGDADALAALFCPDAELVDDAGNVFQGRDEIRSIYAKFAESFPGAKMDLNTESVRFATPEIAIEDGTRTVVTSDAAGAATNRYTMVLVQRNGKWLIASARELADDPQPSPREHLEALAWLVGNWINESNQVPVTISCRWADSGNFLLLDFDSRIQGQSVMHSHQRIGWDPLSRRVRSWVFDSDGGYGQGDWTQLEDRWVIKSAAVLPDGVTGSATIAIQPDGADRFVMMGFDRILGDAVEDDFQVVVVRKPPQPAE